MGTAFKFAIFVALIGGFMVFMISGSIDRPEEILTDPFD